MQSLEIRPRRPEVKYAILNAILKQLGDSPFSVGRSNLRHLLQEIYSLAGENALKRAEQEEN
ncbi:MAG: hypothetical protein WBL92_03740 [Methanothrix sp.]